MEVNGWVTETTVLLSPSRKRMGDGRMEVEEEEEKIALYTDEEEYACEEEGTREERPRPFHPRPSFIRVFEMKRRRLEEAVFAGVEEVLVVQEEDLSSWTSPGYSTPLPWWKQPPRRECTSTVPTFCRQEDDMITSERGVVEGDDGGQEWVVYEACHICGDSMTLLYLNDADHSGPPPPQKNTLLHYYAREHSHEEEEDASPPAVYDEYEYDNGHDHHHHQEPPDRNEAWEEALRLACRCHYCYRMACTDCRASCGDCGETVCSFCMAVVEDEDDPGRTGSYCADCAYARSYRRCEREQHLPSEYDDEDVR